MKYRRDFVTNSSSSSFLFAFKKRESDTIFSVLLDILINADGCCETGTADVFENRDSVDACLFEPWCVHLIEQNAETVCALADQGFCIAVKDIDYSDDSTRNLVKAMDENFDDFVLIMRCD